MPSKDETLLCRYHYDPLDRLADCTPAAQASTRRFYLKERLASEIQGSLQRSIFQHDDQLLAQRQRKDEVSTATLLATDQQRSVLQMLDAAQPHPLAYTPYGHRAQQTGLLSLLGFNGERPDPVTGHYLLGNGYRAFNPVLMRFHSPDSLSPFGKGGLNAYAYCKGNPVNSEDPSGHTPVFLKSLLRGLGIMKKTPRPATTASTASLSSSGAGILNDSGPGRLIERNRRTLSPSSSENALHDFVRPNDRQRRAIRAEANRNLEELSLLNGMIKEDNANFGAAIVLNRKLDPELHDIVVDALTIRDNLLDANNQLKVQLGMTPDYNSSTGLPRYTDALDNIRKGL